MKNNVRPDVIQHARRRVRAGAAELSHARAWLPVRGGAAGRSSPPGSPATAWPPWAPDKMSPGAERLILRAADRTDPRPLWVLAWGGANTLAQALLHVRDTARPRSSTRSSRSCACTRSRIRTMRARGFDASFQTLALHRYCRRRRTVSSTTSRRGLASAAISFYRNGDRGRLHDLHHEWVNANIRSKGPLGQHYPMPCCIHEGDTPSFLGLDRQRSRQRDEPDLRRMGRTLRLATAYTARRDPSWTQGGDSFPGRDNSQDTVMGIDGSRLHVGPGDDLAMAHGVPARFRGTHGLDRQGRRACEPQPVVVLAGRQGRRR